jgi:hypothetical protein
MMWKKIGKFTGIILLIVIFSAGILKGTEISASIDRDVVTKGETFVLEVTVDYTNSPLYPSTPKVPSGLRVVSRSSSNYIQIINGATRKSVKYSYEILAQKIGVYTIYPGTINDKGTIKKANPVKVKVVKNSTSSSSRSQAKKLFWVEANISKKNPYVGEQVIYYFRLYLSNAAARYLASNPDFKSPDFNGFWKFELHERRYSKIINGIRYIVYEVPVALFPTKSGKLTIDSSILNLALSVPSRRRRRSSNPFDDFFNDDFMVNPFRVRRKTLSTDEIVLHVKPLPVDEILPVGKFKLSFSLDKSQVKAGDVITAKVILSGTTNINDLKEPVLKLPDSMEKYSTKENSNTYVRNDKIWAEKSFEFPIVPEKPGKYTIGPVKFKYFDPANGKVKSLKSRVYIIKVDKGNGVIKTQKLVSSDTNAPDTSMTFHKNLKILNEDIRAIKCNVATLNNVEQNNLWEKYAQYIFLLSALLPVLAFLYRKGFFTLKRTQWQKKKAQLTAIKSHLSLLEEGDREKIKDFLALYQKNLAEFLNVAVTQLSGSHLKKTLEDEHLPEELIDGIKDILDKLNYYSVISSPDKKEQEEIVQKIKSNLAFLEKVGKENNKRRKKNGK